jgi:hypothetical protein
VCREGESVGMERIKERGVGMEGKLGLRGVGMEGREGCGHGGDYGEGYRYARMQRGVL